MFSSLHSSLLAGHAALAHTLTLTQSQNTHQAQNIPVARAIQVEEAIQVGALALQEATLHLVALALQAAVEPPHAHVMHSNSEYVPMF
jgi:hypothetical protein